MSPTIHMRACAIAERLLDDLSDRFGVPQAWVKLDDKAKAKEEMMDAWIDIITQEIVK